MKNNQLHGIIGMTFRAVTNMPNKYDQGTVEVLDKVRSNNFNVWNTNTDVYVVMISDTNELCGKVTVIHPNDLIELIKK